ncbi:MAG: hypothetical protein C4325_04570 [Blastocatellia bacterium]
MFRILSAARTPRKEIIISFSSSAITSRRKMLDLIYILAIIGFFLLALAFMRGCEALRKGEDEK